MYYLQPNAFVDWLCSIILVPVALFGMSHPSAHGDSPPPNVLFIAVDDLKPAIGVYGDVHARTPNLDRLAAQGTTFLNAHCQQAVCAPSRVSLLTGLRPDTTKVWDLNTQFRPILPDVVTLPEVFKQAGYLSVGMGKIFDPRSAGGRNSMDRQSWTEDFIHVRADAEETFSFRAPGVVEQVLAAKAEDDYPKRDYGKQLNFVFPGKVPPTDRADVPDVAYHDGAMTEVANQRLDAFAAKGEPFFLAVGFKKPHLPFNAPEKYWQLYNREELPIAEHQELAEGAPEYASQPGWELRGRYRVNAEGPIGEELQRELIHGYYACVSYIDTQLGKLLDKLEETGLSDNTIVVLWGDHGWHLGDQGIWCKHTNYEQATRSPLIVVAPGNFKGMKRGGKTNAPVEFVDVYPTLLDLAGIEPRGELHGVSLRPILEDSAKHVKDVAISQYPRGGKGNRIMGYAFRSERYRLVQWRTRSKGSRELFDQVADTELYDYETDPLETRNLADDPGYAQVRMEMQEKAAAYFERMSN